MTTLKSKSGESALTAILWALLIVFALYPAIELLQLTFFKDGSFTLAPLSKMLSQEYNVRAFKNSIGLATAVASCGTILGFIFAYTVTRLSLPAFVRGLIGAITLLPLISPPFTSSIALTLSLGPNGLLLKMLGLKDIKLYGFRGTLLSEVLTYFPIAYMTLRTTLSRLDPNFEDAAFSLGASPKKVFRSVTLPLCLPGLTNSFLLLFAASLADFATPLVLGGHSFPLLPTEAYLQITGLYDFSGGASLSFLLLLPALFVFWLQGRLTKGKSFVTLSGKAGGQSRIRSTSLGAKIFILTIVTLVSCFVLYLYSLILWGSFVKVWGINNSFTLANYGYVFTFGKKALKDTLLIAAITTPLGGLFSALLALKIARSKTKGNKVLELLSLLNYALPGTVVGIAYLVAFNDAPSWWPFSFFPFILTGGVTILVAAYLFRYSSAGIRGTLAALAQLDPSLEEASLSLGASGATTFRKITLPLILPATLSGMKYLFIHSMTAISATIFLVSVQWSLLTTRILECVTELQFAQACAFSILLILLVFIVGGLLDLCVKIVPQNATERGRG